MPIPFSRGYSRNKDPDHVPRPRNAFMLFRSAFAAAQNIGTNIEHDNRHITRIIAHCWNRLSESEKQVWRNKAATEKAIHAMKYPNYRFHPIVRAQKPAKRKVRRNGTEDKRRCKQVAELLLAGKHGEDLEVAVKEIDDSLKVPVSGTSSEPRRGSASKGLQGWESRGSDFDGCDIQPFRSPLLPPAKTLQTYDSTGATPVSQPVRTFPSIFDLHSSAYSSLQLQSTPLHKVMIIATTTKRTTSISQRHALFWSTRCSLPSLIVTLYLRVTGSPHFLRHFVANP